MYTHLSGEVVGGMLYVYILKCLELPCLHKCAENPCVLPSRQVGIVPLRVHQRDRSNRVHLYNHVETEEVLFYDHSQGPPMGENSSERW